MPLYSYECRDCGEVTDAHRRVDDRNNCPSCKCGGETEKVISGYRVIGDLEPYYDDNLQTHIQGRQHRQRVMAEQGVSEGYGKNWWVKR